MGRPHTITLTAATGTFTPPVGRARTHDAVLRAATTVLRDRFGIRHTTSQIDADVDCGAAGHA